MTIYDGAAKGTAVMSSFPTTIGINYFLATTGVRSYIGLEVGAYQQKGDGYVTINGDKHTVVTYTGGHFVFVPTFGISMPLNKNLALQSNLKFHMNSDEGFINTGINVGIAYLIP